MKKLYILCLIFLGLNISLKAQNYIVQGGLNFYFFPSVTYSELSSLDQLLITPNLFLYDETELTKTFSFIAGIGINAKGRRELSFEFTSLYYLEIPLLISFKYPIDEKYNLFGKIGPSFGLLLLNSEMYSIRDYNGNRTWYKNFRFFDNIIETFEFNINLSVGLEYKKYLFELKYAMGFNYPYRRILYTENGFNQGISLSFGYKFKTKK
jgi:hypothetical protein